MVYAYVFVIFVKIKMDKNQTNIVNYGCGRMDLVWLYISCVQCQVAVSVKIKVVEK